MEPVRYADLKKSSRNPHTLIAAKEKFPSPQASRSLRMRDQMKSEKHIIHSYTFLHHEVKQNGGSGPLLAPKSTWNYQKQFLGKKAMKDDELVKHMSNLPCYLQRMEKGENVQEKVLNFGVLDWQRLENWKDNQKQVSGRGSMYSPSNSNTSSVFSTVESSSLSSGSDSGILTQRKQSPSRQPHVTNSSKGRHSQGKISSTRGNVAPRNDFRTVPKNASVRQQKLHGTNISRGNNLGEVKFEKGKEKGSNRKFSSEMGIPSSNSKNEACFAPKGKIKAPEGAPTQRTKESQESALSDQRGSDRNRNIVLILPIHSVKKSCSGVPQDTEMITLDGDRQKEANPTRFSDGLHAEMAMSSENRQTRANRRKFSDGFCISEEVHFSEVYPDIPHSCPVLPGNETSKHSDMNSTTYIDAQGKKVSSDDSHISPCSGETPTVQSKDKQAEEKQLARKPMKKLVVEHFSGSGLNTMEPSTMKGISQSPNCRSKSGVNKISRSFSSKESAALPHLSSSYAKSSLVVSDACSNSSNRDIATPNSKARSSPLRRLLDPLLKSKSANRINSCEPLQDESTPLRKVCKSIDGSGDSSVEPVKRALKFSNNFSGAHQNERHMESIVQALLQVSVRNGLPWFTFAVNNNNDILAATMRKVSASGKYDCSWVYTFYSFHKTKKKHGGWLNPASSGSRDYVPSIVGQMEVSDSQFSKLTRHESKDQAMRREFVLFGVEPRHTDQDTVDFHQNGELASIVIKVPIETKGSSITNDGKLGNDDKHASRIGLHGVSTEKKFGHSSVGSPKTGSTIGSHSSAKVVVILPRGVHGMPVTGLPSTLIDRWRSGGSCDCGGWDVGCQLRVLSNQDHCIKNDAHSPKLRYTQEHIDLFIQGGETQEKCPFYSMLTYNKGVHSIDFDASVSTLQAFSISVAFLHSKNLAKVSYLFQEMSTHKPTSVETERVKAPTPIDEKVPRSMASPPLSPVGRV